MVSTKNHYNYWRPVTAIREGDTDGNPATTGDPTWTSLRATPAGSGLRLGSQHRRGRRCGGAEAVLRHRSNELPGLQRDVASLVAPVAVRHRCSARIPASPRLRPRTPTRASSSGSTSASRSKRGLPTAETSAGVPPTSISALSIEIGLLMEPAATAAGTPGAGGAHPSPSTAHHPEPEPGRRTVHDLTPDPTSSRTPLPEECVNRTGGRTFTQATSPGTVAGRLCPHCDSPPTGIARSTPARWPAGSPSARTRRLGPPRGAGGGPWSGRRRQAQA